MALSEVHTSAKAKQYENSIKNNPGCLGDTCLIPPLKLMQIGSILFA